MLTIPFHLQDFLMHDLLHFIFLFDVINLLKNDGPNEALGTRLLTVITKSFPLTAVP